MTPRRNATPPSFHRRAWLPALVVAASLALVACSSDDDDDDGMDPVTTDETGDETGDGIMPAPGVTPGGDETVDGPVEYVIPLTVTEEIPAPTAPDGAGGTATLTFDPETNGLTGTVATSGLSGAPTMAHIHEGAFGENGDILVPFVADGSGTGFALPDDTVLSAERVEQLESGGLYVNVHTDANPMGEIRGQIVEQDPEGDGT